MWLIWQNPESRLFVKVGCLEQRHDGRYSFRYLPSAKNQADFSPVVQFPLFDREYVSDALPEFFANRVMSPRRENYGEYVSWLGLASPAEPVEVLVRTGGSRATDTFHIVDDLHVAADGAVTTRFFASGIRHVPGAPERLVAMKPGQPLSLRTEVENPQNSRALLIDVQHQEPVGYIPNWLLADVHQLCRVATEWQLTAERINVNAPAHLRLLCRLHAQT